MSAIDLKFQNVARDLKLRTKLGAVLTLREEVYVTDVVFASQSSTLQDAKVMSDLYLAPALRGPVGPPGRIGTVSATAFSTPPGTDPSVNVDQTPDGVHIDFYIPTPNNARLVTNVGPSTLQAGQPVTMLSGGGVVAAQANNASTFNVAGLVSSGSIPPGQTGYILVNGIIKIEPTVLWDQVVVGGSGGLLTGLAYYLDWVMPGKLTATPTDVVGNYRVPCGFALSSTELEIQLGLNVQL